jgi:hypothetical protein
VGGQHQECSNPISLQGLLRKYEQLPAASRDLVMIVQFNVLWEDLFEKSAKGLLRPRDEKAPPNMVWRHYHKLNNPAEKAEYDKYIVTHTNLNDIRDVRAVTERLDDYVIVQPQDMELVVGKPAGSIVPHEKRGFIDPIMALMNFTYEEAPFHNRGVKAKHERAHTLWSRWCDDDPVIGKSLITGQVPNNLATHYERYWRSSSYRNQMEENGVGSVLWFCRFAPAGDAFKPGTFHFDGYEFEFEDPRYGIGPSKMHKWASAEEFYNTRRQYLEMCAPKKKTNPLDPNEGWLAPVSVVKTTHLRPCKRGKQEWQTTHPPSKVYKRTIDNNPAAADASWHAAQPRAKLTPAAACKPRVPPKKRATSRIPAPKRAASASGPITPQRRLMAPPGVNQYGGSSGSGNRGQSSRPAPKAGSGTPQVATHQNSGALIRPFDAYTDYRYTNPDGSNRSR